MNNSQPAPKAQGDETDSAVTVLLFAALKDVMGSDHMTVQLAPANASITVADFLAQCGAQHPAIAAWLPHIRVAINCAYADNSDTIAPGDEIALLPPVSGGAG